MVKVGKADSKPSGSVFFFTFYFDSDQVGRFKYSNLVLDYRTRSTTNQYKVNSIWVLSSKPAGSVFFFTFYFDSNQVGRFKFSKIVNKSKHFSRY